MVISHMEQDQADRRTLHATAPGISDFPGGRPPREKPIPALARIMLPAFRHQHDSVSAPRQRGTEHASPRNCSLNIGRTLSQDKRKLSALHPHGMPSRGRCRRLKPVHEKMETFISEQKLLRHGNAEYHEMICH
jgi:hypothetical protein